MLKASLLLFTLSSIACANCDVPSVVAVIRPGAEWTISDNDVSTLVWLSTQTIPTKAEVIQAISDCRTQAAARLALKQQARLDVKNTGLTPLQRLQALLILLDYDQ